MKRKLAIALVSVIALILLFSTSVLADDGAGYWEYWAEEGYQDPDPCVAANEDFINGWGFDEGVYVDTGGVQEWTYTNLPNDGYNLYRDDVTGTGNLDRAGVLTQTPDEVDLPIMTEHHDEPTATYWRMRGASPDTWYWALEPETVYIMTREAGCRWIETFTPEAGIRIILPDASEWFLYCGKAVSTIDFNDGTWRIQIPAGTWITYSSGAQAVQLKVDSDGNIVNGVTFTCQRGGEVTITKM